jgi:hypothetical protein
MFPPAALQFRPWTQGERPDQSCALCHTRYFIALGLVISLRRQAVSAARKVQKVQGGLVA